MAGMGPPPKAADERRRRGASSSTVRLPASGRPGDAPDWPLVESPPEPAELAVWRRLWSKPQAVAWERMRIEEVVARYARAVIEAQHPASAPAVKAEARQLEDRLGLSPMALVRLRWEIVDDDADAGRADVAPSVDLDEFSDRLRRRAFGSG